MSFGFGSGVDALCKLKVELVRPVASVPMRFQRIKDVVDAVFLFHLFGHVPV